MDVSEMMRFRVLYLDDDQISLAVAQRVLSSCGFDITITTKPADLLDAGELPYHLVMLDLIMPGMDGFAVCQSLRSEGYKGPILMLSAKALASHERRLLEEYHADFLSKPFGPQQLVSRVRQCIAEGAKRG